jgi:hypothetical protein
MNEPEFPSAPEVVVKMIRGDYENLKGRVRMLKAYADTDEKKGCHSDMRGFLVQLEAAIEEAEIIFK